MASLFSVKFYNRLDESVKSVWQDIETESDHYVFQSYDWLSCWYKTICIKSVYYEPLIIIIYDEGDTPVALFPFVIRNFYGAKILEFMGGVQCDYNSPLISPKICEAHLVEIWQLIISKLPRHDLKNLTRIPRIIDGTENIFLRILDGVVSDGSAYSMTLPKSWESYSSRFSLRFKSDSNRSIRKISEQGNLIYIKAKNHIEYESIIETLFTQKERRYKETGARNIFNNTHTKNFYREIFKYKDTFNVHLSSLKFESELLATNFGVRYKGRFYYLIPTFSRTGFEKYSPGRILLKMLFEESIKECIDVFDFTTGGEEYKKIWCDTSMPVFRIVKSESLKGDILKNLFLILTKLKSEKYTKAIIMSIMKTIYKLKFYER